MMGLMWFCLGLIAGLSVFVARELHKRFDIDWRGWAGLGLGEVLVFFCIAWSVAAAAEGEPRSALMGIMMFGAPGVAVLALSSRLFVFPAERRSQS
jgi:uncharacterized membrane protein YedE/YeeE